MARHPARRHPHNRADAHRQQRRARQNLERVVRAADRERPNHRQSPRPLYPVSGRDGIHARRGHAPAQLDRNPRRPSQPQTPHYRVANLSLPATTIRQRRPIPRCTSSWTRTAQQPASPSEKPAPSALARPRPQRGRAGVRPLSQGRGSTSVEVSRRKHRANFGSLGYRIHARRPDPAQAGGLGPHGQPSGRTPARRARKRALCHRQQPANRCTRRADQRRWCNRRSGD